VLPGSPSVAYVVNRATYYESQPNRLYVFKPADTPETSCTGGTRLPLSLWPAKSVSRVSPMGVAVSEPTSESYRVSYPPRDSRVE